MRTIIRAVAACVALAAAGTLAAQAPDGAASYKQGCALCHDGGMDRAPSREAFQQMTPERVLNAMENGPMISMAVRFNPAQRRAIAEYLAGKAFSTNPEPYPAAKAMCAGAPGAFTMPAAGPLWNGWGLNASNTRFQTAAGAGFTAADVPRLKVKWAFAFPGELTRMGAPVLAGGRVFVGSADGKVYALDAASGCIQWMLDTGSSVRSALSLASIQTPEGQKTAAFFGDGRAFAYAVDAATGKQLWKTKVDDFPSAGITGGLVFYRNRVYVPVRSGEEATGASPTYECCRFRGNLVALDAATGKQIWKTYLVDEPKPTIKNAQGTQLWGPSGAPVWSTPAIDTRRNTIYVTTGDNYSEPASKMSDSFVALDAETGKIQWSRQMTANDAYTAACRLPDKTNCPSVNGPDFDFGASPILVTLGNGKRLLVAGQKSGLVHALDPDQGGELVWSTRVGKGGTMGGVQWGSAADANMLYVANSDIGRIMLPFTNNTDADPKKGGGMYALRLDTGKQVWFTPPVGCGEKTRCSPAQSGAVTAIPGVAFSGSVDGHLRAYAAADGKIIWDVDTATNYQGVNGVAGRGGSLDGAGPVIGAGMMYVNSGYSSAGGIPGNVMLAFSVDGK
jgi:polyvinyl alcohol dehydrogenase (cytochrome)